MRRATSLDARRRPSTPSMTSPPPTGVEAVARSRLKSKPCLVAEEKTPYGAGLAKGEI